MSAFPFAVEQAFLELAAVEVDELAQLLDHEPKDLGSQLPALTLHWVLPRDEDLQTGPLTTVTWLWDVRVYVSLRSGYEQAQRELRSIVAKLLAVIRHDPSLKGTCDWARLVGDDSPSTYDDDQERAAWFRMRLSAIREES